MMTLFLAETGNPVEQVLEKMSEVGDMGEWNVPEKQSNDAQPNNRAGNSNPNRVSRRDMFQALLKAGVPLETLDGIPSKDMWQLDQDKVKRANKVNVKDENKDTNPFSVATPTALSVGLYPFDELSRLTGNRPLSRSLYH